MIALAAHRRPVWPLAFPLDPGGLVTAVADQFAALALDYFETGVFVLDADSRIHFASAAARRLLETGRLCSHNGLLVSSVGWETTTLRRIVKQHIAASSSSPAQMMFHRLGDVEDVLCLGLVSARGPSGGKPDKQFLIVFATKPCEIPPPDTRQLRSHFGLTEAQAKLAIEITKGEGLKACTRRLGIAMSTGRTHLRQIFEKTETRRQAELVRLISACRFNLPVSAGVHRPPDG